MDFEHIVKTRYATKLFDGKRIPEDTIEKLLEIIRFAPSSFNIQPWFIKVVADKETKEKIHAAAWNQPQITSCSHLLVFCARTDVANLITQLEKLLQGKMPAPNLEAYVKIMRNFETGLSLDAKRTWAQRQLYLALGNAVNGAKSLGFDSCPMEGFDPSAVAHILELPPYIIPTALCALGYAADTAPPKSRFEKNEVFSR